MNASWHIRINPESFIKNIPVNFLFFFSNWHCWKLFHHFIISNGEVKFLQNSSNNQHCPRHIRILWWEWFWREGEGVKVSFVFPFPFILPGTLSIIVAAFSCCGTIVLRSEKNEKLSRVDEFPDPLKPTFNPVIPFYFTR